MTLTINLTNNEKRVLLALSKKDKFSPQDLAAASELSIEASMQSAFMLAEKNLCEIKETVKTTYNLTKEGEQYAQISLPERQVINLLKEPISLSELKQKFPPQMVGIALGWLRKKNWVKIEGDRIIPVEKAEVGEDENILTKLKKGPLSDIGEAVKDLIKRNLVEKTEKKSRVHNYHFCWSCPCIKGFTYRRGNRTAYTYYNHKWFMEKCTYPPL